MILNYVILIVFVELKYVFKNMTVYIEMNTYKIKNVENTVEKLKMRLKSMWKTIKKDKPLKKITLLVLT